MTAAILSLNARAGDAIGNHVAALVRYFDGHAVRPQVFLSSSREVHPAVAPCVESMTADALVEHAPDLVIAQFGADYELLDALPILAARGSRIIFDYHGVTPSTQATGRLRRELLQAEQRRGLVWCSREAWVRSRFMARELYQATRFPMERIRLLPCQHEPRMARSSVDVRAALGLHDAQVLLFVGRIAPNKNLPVLIEATARLFKEGRDVHAVLIGDDTDAYAGEATKCRELCRQLEIEHKVHLLGRVNATELASWYSSADLLVLPSRHEGFGLPVIEAMGAGLPIVAARAGALPETVGDAGLTFAPEDAGALARQVERVLLKSERPALAPIPAAAGNLSRVAIVTPRFGTGFVGGAERSLSVMAQSLRRAGHSVEIFTTCTKSASNWSNEASPGITKEDGLVIQRFPVDAVNRAAHDAALAQVVRTRGVVPAEVEQAYLQNSLRSGALIEALAVRKSDFDAILVGPYLFGLTHDVATAFRDQVMLVPCFHDEPLARLQAFTNAYSEVGGTLYHTEPERFFAEAELGINHPNAVVVGTCLRKPMQPQGVRPAGDYVVYCGRYCAEKGVDTLLQWFAGYVAQGGSLRLVLMGEGGLPLPKAPWLVQLGFVDEARKHAVLRDARALVQLSPNESLSLVALEGWQHGVPVIGNRASAVVTHLIESSSGGASVSTEEEFRQALVSVETEPGKWRAAGQRGREFVAATYEAEETFLKRLRAALAARTRPLAEQMRRKGRLRAALYNRSNWESALARLLANQQSSASETPRTAVAGRFVESSKRVAMGAGEVLIPLEITNVGELPLSERGPARVSFQARVSADGAESMHGRGVLPARLVEPGAKQLILLPVPVPNVPGSYVLDVAATCPPLPCAVAIAPIQLEVVMNQDQALSGIAQPFVQAVEAALAEVDKVRELPTDYDDVTLGRLAGIKKQVKAKLLHNFRKAYVEVLARQQSEVNEHLLTALHQLTSAVTAVEQANDSAGLLRKCLKRQRQLDRRLRRLEMQLGRIERDVSDDEVPAHG